MRGAKRGGGRSKREEGKGGKRETKSSTFPRVHKYLS